MRSNLSKTFKYVNSAGEFIILDFGHGFLTNKPIGIDTISVSNEIEQGINQTGGTVRSSNVQPRPVNISGILVGDFQSENKDKLISTVRPDIPGRLYADDLYLDVVLTSTPSVSPAEAFADFQFSLLAPYPYWKKDGSTKSSLATIEKKFKFPFNVSRPYRFGEAIEQQFVTVLNNGQTPVPYTVIFTSSGSVVNPKLTDAKTGQFLLINKTMDAGERLTVRITHERTYVNSSVDGECRGTLDLSSNLFRLQKGENVLKPDSESGKAGLQVIIEYSTEIVGVVV